MIIVEGPDGGGKTTLIRGIMEWTGLEVASRVVSKDTEALVDLQVWVDDNLAAGFQPTIFDRHRLISEPIYGPELRTYLEPGFSDPHWFSTRLGSFYKLQPVVIYCLPPYGDVLNNIVGDPDNAAVLHRIKEIYFAYFNKAMTEKHLRTAGVFLYDYTSGSEPELPFSSLEEIIFYINHRITRHNRSTR